MRTSTRFLRFNLVGLIGIVIQLGAIWMLTEVAHLPAAVATLLAVAFTIVHNFVWHRRWTWADRDGQGALAALGRFVLANGAVSLVGNVGLVWWLTQATPMRAVPANAIAIVVCGVLNFWLADRAVFRARSVAERANRSDARHLVSRPCGARTSAPTTLR